MPHSQPSVRTHPQFVASKQHKDPVCELSLGSWLLPDRTAGHTHCLVQGRARCVLSSHPHTAFAVHLLLRLGLLAGLELLWRSRAAPDGAPAAPVAIRGLRTMSLQVECKLSFCVCCVMLKRYLSVPGAARWWFTITSEAVLLCVLELDWHRLCSCSLAWEWQVGCS